MKFSTKFVFIPLSVLGAIFALLVIKEVIYPSEEQNPSKSEVNISEEKQSVPEKPVPKESKKPTVKKPAACSFTREPEETWPDEKAADPPIGNVKLIKNFHLKTYDVFGSRVYKVNDSVNEKGPSFTKTLDGIAAANAEISGQWDREETTGGCARTSGTAIIDIILRIPEWVNKTAAPVQDQQMWDLYLKFLKNHEQGHINIGLKAARGLQAELAQPRSAPTCQELDNAMQKLFDETNLKVVEANAEYDNRTGHGYTQRPDFPFTCKWSEIKL